MYNEGVKDQLIDMCTQVLKFISDMVFKTVLQSIRQSSSTSGTFNLMSPMSSESLMEIFNYNILSSVENSLSQAFCDVIGSDIPVRISPKFTKAIASEVLNEGVSVISVAIQDSLNGGPSSSMAPASCRVSKDRAAEKCLAGAISTMKSFLTGQVTVVKRRITTQKGSDNKNKTPARGHSARRKESLWRRCFSGKQRRKIHSVLLEDLTESRSVQKSKQDSPSPRETSSTTSSSANLKADLRSTPLKLEDYVEDGDMTPADHQILDISLSKDLEDPSLAGASSDELHEEMSTSYQSQSSVEETEAKTRGGFCSFFRNVFTKVRMHLHGN